MGYPMHYRRALARNRLADGDYDGGSPIGNIRGDLRRLETDTLDDRHVSSYARLAGTTKPKAAKVLRAFLGVPEPDCPKCAAYSKPTDPVRCDQHHVVSGIR